MGANALPPNEILSLEVILQNEETSVLQVGGQVSMIPHSNRLCTCTRLMTGPGQVQLWLCH